MENKAPSSYPLKLWAAVGPPSKVPSAYSLGVPTTATQAPCTGPQAQQTPGAAGARARAADLGLGAGGVLSPRGLQAPRHTHCSPPESLPAVLCGTPRPEHRPAVNKMPEKTLRHRLATVVATAAATISVCRGSPSLESGQGADFSTHRASVCPPLAKTLRGQGLGSGRGAGNLPPLLVRVGRLYLNF